jgi:hypothetical protein
MKHFTVPTGGIDLHVHSNFSDGSFSPDDVFDFARSIGLEAVGLCDHDTVAGHADAARAAARCGIEFVPGMEFTAVWLGKEHHLLGYYLDTSEPAFLRALATCRDERRLRGIATIEKMRALGFDIPDEGVRRQRGGPDEIGGDGRACPPQAGSDPRARTSAARAESGVVDRGDVLRHMQQTGQYAGSFSDGFRKFFYPGSPGYILPYAIGGLEPLTLERAIRIIHGAGGAAVFGHPMGFYVKEMSRGELKQAADFGVDGLEVYHPNHSDEARDFLLTACRDFNLLVTGGTDCHGKVKDAPKMGTLRVSNELLPPLKARAAYLQSRRKPPR